jgi:pyridinium-3,5-biscarboxylic acid mononucleotide sulfurtransferase
MRAEISFGADRAAVDRVIRQLAGVGRLGVAFSGGVDSATLLALAVRALGAGQVVALLGVSPSLAADERAAAHDVARFVGVPVVEVETREGDRPEYRANGPDRCFHCKDELFMTIGAEVLDRHGLDRIAYGENADDVRRPDRPGAQAATRHHVLRPLADAGLDKAAVRRVARVLGLPCADKPAAPCLASRIPHHEPVTPAKLAQVEAAERALRALGFTDCRVRHHGDVARIELPTGEIARAVVDVREDLLRAVVAAGFRFVAVDLAGIQSGAFTLPLVTVGRE